MVEENELGHGGVTLRHLTAALAESERRGTSTGTSR